MDFSSRIGAYALNGSGLYRLDQVVVAEQRSMLFSVSFVPGLRVVVLMLRSCHRYGAVVFTGKLWFASSFAFAGQGFTETNK